MTRCEKCNAATERLPLAKRTGLQQVDSFMFPGLGDALYWGQRRKLKCSSCGHVQPARDGFGMRLLKRLLIAGAIVGSFAGIGVILAANSPATTRSPLLDALAGLVREHALVVILGCTGAAFAIAVLAIDGARIRHRSQKSREH